MQKQRKKPTPRRDLSHLTLEERRADKKAYMTQWRADNVKHRHDYHQERYWNDPGHYRTLASDYHSENKEACNARSKKRYWKDPAKNIARVIEWGKKNPELVRANRRNSYKKRYSEDLGFRILCSLRGRLTKVTRLAAAKKFNHTFKLLGCDLLNFMIYLESKFEPGMTWDAFREGRIHIDHVIPCDLFDLTNPVHQEYCFHFSNLAPLWKLDNLKKNKYVSADFNLSEHLSKPLSPTPALGTEPQLLTSGIDTTCPLMGEP